VVAFYGSERVILVKPSDPKSWLNKVKNVLAIVDKELGYADTELGGLSNSQVFYAEFELHIILSSECCLGCDSLVSDESCITLSHHRGFLYNISDFHSSERADCFSGLCIFNVL
jgi:hypothetical protein